jgi:hypothetical protein
MKYRRICKHGVVDYPAWGGPSKHVIVTTMDGQRIAMHPICDMERAIESAMHCADRRRDWTAQIELQCWSLGDVCQSLGIDPRSLNITRDEVVAALKTVLVESQDAFARRQAFDELVKMEVIL